ncbi:oxygen-regulated protein 1 [Electrophorus electricus]|uniref:oxygen-regulated protein 1 n=1 Tax=Electrophorus electricus TaxID=8005 RepID=UPI0015D0AA9E|nr:oxygen-regulated protein 1 [Electrophorus electricus]
MSTTPQNGTLQADVLSKIICTQPSNPPPSTTDPNASKRVCFYKSDDPEFSAKQIIISSRTFRTFDALLDALSKKVPLTFGVRTITTPRGTHTIRRLDDLWDGASYVCSDQKRAKPLNLKVVSKSQVPWSTARHTSPGHRQLIRQLVKQCKTDKMDKMTENNVWSPKRLLVFKNRDPSTKHTVVLQRRTAPTFSALLDYISRVMHFRVVKLYTADGKRVNSLPALILCSGVMVAAGNEPFRVANYSLQKSSQLSRSTVPKSPRPATTESVPSGIRSRRRNFSLSSERYFVNKINMSLNGGLSHDNGQKAGSVKTNITQPSQLKEMGICDSLTGRMERDHFIMPSENDIEKSFHVNQDGSMTIEMKVHLHVNQEEMIGWTTTLSRACVNSQQRAVCSQPVSGYDSQGYDYDAVKKAKTHSSDSEGDNTAKPMKVDEEREDHCESAISEALVIPKAVFRRLPTPGPKCVKRKEGLGEKIKRAPGSEVQQSTVGAYSDVEHTAEEELTKGLCVVSHSSGSTKPVIRPRKKSSAEAKHRNSGSTLRSVGMAEVLQLRNNGRESTETVMNIHQSESTYENDLRNAQVATDKKFGCRIISKNSHKPDSPDSGPHSSKNDWDINLIRKSLEKSSDSQNKSKKSKKDKWVGQLPNINCCDQKEKDINLDDTTAQQSAKKVNTFDCNKLKGSSQNAFPSFTKKILNVLPPAYLSPFKKRAKQRSVTERTELCEGISRPVLHSSLSNVHQYVKNWLEKLQRPYNTEYESRSVFQIRSDEQESCLPKLLEALVSIKPDTEGETQSTEVNARSGMIPILEHLCLSIQSIKRASSHSCLTSLEQEMPSSLPDMPSQAVSAFGSSCKVLLFFLSVMIMRDVIFSTGNEDRVSDWSSYPEALQVMQSLEKISKTEDEEELKAGLSSLLSSTSSQLKKRWRDFQDKNDIERYVRQSPRHSEKEFGLEVGSEGENQANEDHFLLKEVMHELKMSEIFYLVEEELANVHHLKPAKDHSRINITSETGCVNEDGTMKDDSGGFLDKVSGYSKMKESPDEISKTKKAGVPEFEELHSVQFCPPDSPLLETYLVKGKSNFKTSKKLSENMNNVQATAKKCRDDNTTQVDEHEVPYHNETEEKKENQENVVCIQSESESVVAQLHVHTSEIETISFSGKDSGVNDDQDIDTIRDHDIKSDSLEEHVINAEDKVTYQETRQYTEQPDTITIGSESDDVEAHHHSNKPDSGEEHRDKCKDAYEDIQPHHPEASLEDCESDSEAQAHHPEPSLEDCESEARYKNLVLELFHNHWHHNIPTEDDDTDEDTKNRSASCKRRESDAEYERRQALQTLDEESLIEKTSSPGTEDEEANEHVKELHISLDNDQDVDGHHAHRVDLETADSIRRELYNTIQSQETEKYKAQTEYRMAAASGDHGCNCVHPIVIPQELLDFVSLALLSSALTFTYDSNGHLRIEPHRCKLREMSLAIRNVDHQNVQRCLPTPNTSDLSDYRPETSDSGGDLSQVSTDLLTESGEEEAERLWIYQSNMTRGPEEFRSCTKALDNGSVKPHPATDIKITASPRLNSINSLASIDDSVSHTTVQELTYIKSSGSFETDYPVQNLASHTVGNSSAGILIDKGRWLLKENHLIRKSPPDPLGMYENADTTSTDTGQENTTEEASYPSYESQHPPLAVISSSELEEMTKPHTPKCTYFNMLHSSDSDHFLDNQSVSSNKGGDRIRKSWELKVSPMGESSQMLAKKSGSLPSFASVDFKLADGKVHPEFGVSGAVEKSPRSQSLSNRAPPEEDPIDGLNFRCCQHCTIL